MPTANEELNLLIKSKYPLVYFETVDEIYTIKQLRAIARQVGLDFYQWSLTDGLRRGDNDEPYYRTKEPVKMLRMVQYLVKPRADEEFKPGLFVLKDFEKHLEDDLTLRLLKDVINRIRGTPDTLVIVAAEYKLPKDIEPDSARLLGGYPIEDEIKAVIRQTAEELRRTNEKVALSLSDEALNVIATALKGLSIQQIRNVISQCLLANNVLDINALTAIETYKEKVFDQEGLLEFCLTEDKGNIAGFDNLKRWLEERKDSFSPQRTTSLPAPRGLLLMGVQGCGKSLATKVIARELNLPLYRLDLARLYSKYIGETERNLRTALMIAEKLCPICLWIDEIEKGFAASGGDIDGGVSQRILGTFLTWMQERKADCFIAATANDIYRLPPEFLRKGRFDEIFFVDLPDAESREQLLRIHLRKRGLAPEDFDLRAIVDVTLGFSGAEIEQAVIAALYRASTDKQPISSKHVVEQIESTKPLSVLKEEEISALRAWAKERTIPA
jgi:SpoVK/Ycf46/Vps4 family AAA+-type ATPase